MTTDQQNTSKGRWMEWQEFNVNDEVKVRLTKRGKTIHRQQYESSMSAFLDKYPYEPPKEDAQGWSNWQLWKLMQEFGQHTYNGSDPCFQTTIQFPLTAASPSPPEGREVTRVSLIRAMCHARGEACKCADRGGRIDDYDACRIVSKHANAIISNLLAQSNQDVTGDAGKGEQT